jgi:hypothetical protein
MSAGATLAACLMPCTALTQVRTEASPAALVDPVATRQAQALFERSGLFMIAGGVLPVGHAAFFLERGGATVPVDAASLHLVADPGGDVALRGAGATYLVGMPHGLACPLGRFVARDGLIAYTVPKYIDPESRSEMLRAGLLHHHIAREFDGTAFAALLKAADFGATVPLPPGVAERITDGINAPNGIRGLVIAASEDMNGLIGSYINSGMQVTYHVYLMAGSGRVEIGGVPLRYFWKMEPGGAAGVFSVEMYAQNWPAGTALSDVTAPGARPTQYDVVNFYQVAGLFWQMHDTDKDGFARFVDQACASPG